MGMNPIRRDNVMQNMALEANMLENERKRSRGEPVTPAKRAMGKICFWVLMIAIVAIVGIYIAMHL